MPYLAYHFNVEPPQPGSEILAAMIADLGFESFDYNESGFTAYIRKENAANVKMDEFQFPDFQFSFRVETLEDKNWNEEWEKSFDPVVVEDLLCIRAPFHEPNTVVKHEIVIMPKMSFGTGHHQTTRLMCRQMFNLDLKGKRILDMGCGTGILAILACKLGAKDVLDIDIDKWCVENSIENCNANGCSAVTVELGDVDLIKNEPEFDIILANINKNILKAQIPVYSEKLKKAGSLLISGFFGTDVKELSDFSADFGLKFVSTENENEWAMMKLVKT